MVWWMAFARLFSPFTAGRRWVCASFFSAMGGITGTKIYSKLKWWRSRQPVVLNF